MKIEKKYLEPFIKNVSDYKEIAEKIGPIFPADSINKCPIAKGWQQNATRSPEGINFDKGLAIKTGNTDASNLVVIDTDNDIARQFLEDNLSDAELETFTVKTRRGFHSYYSAPAGATYKGAQNLFGIKGLDVRSEGNFIIAPPSDGYTIRKNVPIAPIPDFLKSIIGVYTLKQHGLSPKELDEFQLQESTITWEFLRNIDPNLDRNNWIKILSICKFHCKDGYEVALYWSALSEEKFEGLDGFRKTWDSIQRADATLSSLLYLSKEHQWHGNFLPRIPFNLLDEARVIAKDVHNEVRRLLRRSNILTESEDKYLKLSSKILAFSLLSVERERIALPLPTGFGKSTLMRCLIKALKEREVDRKLLVCVASHNEILENIVELGKMGISGDTVGVFTSDKYKSDWDVSLSEAESKRVIFICHSRVYKASDYDSLSPLTGSESNKRLILWDESAQTASGEFIDANELEEQVGGQLSRLNKWHPDNYHQFKDWLENLQSLFQNQKYSEHWIDTIEVPVRYPYPIKEELKKLIANSGSYVSFTKHDEKQEAVFTVECRIPDQMQFIIFDASAAIRKIINYDKSIKVLDTKIERDYSDCQITCVPLRSSRGHLNNVENVKIQIAILKEWMKEDGIVGDELLVTVRKCKDESDETLINIKSMVEEEIPGVHVIKWGSERGINEFRDKKYTANIGMMWRDRKDLQADILAQKRNLSSRVSRTDIDETQDSEFLSEVQQWVARTNMRTSKNGKALETKILFIHNNAYRIAQELERRVFPGLQIALWETDVSDATQLSVQRVKMVVDYLRSLDEEQISVYQLKKALGLSDLSKDQWGTIASHAEDLLECEWERQGRSWVRLGIFGGLVATPLECCMI